MYEGRGAEVQGNNYYVVVTRDVLASMQDYYLKKAKILKKQEVDLIITDLMMPNTGSGVCLRKV